MKQLFLLFFLIVSFGVDASCVINCRVRYRYKVEQKIQQGTYNGSVIGEGTIYAPEGVVIGGDNQDYNYAWSDYYNVSLTFYSGYELNEALNVSYFSNNSLIGYLHWENGGYSSIILNDWFTQMKYVTKEEVLTETATGRQISYVNGWDTENIYWEIYF